MAPPLGSRVAEAVPRECCRRPQPPGPWLECSRKLRPDLLRRARERWLVGKHARRATDVAACSASRDERIRMRRRATLCARALPFPAFTLSALGRAALESRCGCGFLLARAHSHERYGAHPDTRMHTSRAALRCLHRPLIATVPSRASSGREGRLRVRKARAGLGPTKAAMREVAGTRAQAHDTRRAIDVAALLVLGSRGQLGSHTLPASPAGRPIGSNARAGLRSAKAALRESAGAWASTPAAPPTLPRLPSKASCRHRPRTPSGALGRLPQRLKSSRRLRPDTM